MMPSKADSVNDIILEMHHVGNYGGFSCIYNNDQCDNEGEDREEATFEQITLTSYNPIGLHCLLRG
jgi:hypothetical protein